MIAEADSGPSALTHARAHAPDIISTDLSMPNVRVSELVAIAPVVMFTALDADHARIVEAQHGGVRAVVSKQRPPEDLLEQIRSALGLTRSRHIALSRREREVLGLAGRGFTNGQMAEQLGLREGTIRTHVRSALHKLGARSRTEAVAMVGTVSLDEI